MRIRDWSSDVCSSDLLEWRAEVPGDRLSELEPGMRADLRRPGDGALVHGKIRQLAPTVDLQSRNALVYVDLPKDAGLTAGQFVEGAFETGQHRSEEHKFELQSLMRISYAVLCLKKKIT